MRGVLWIALCTAVSLVSANQCTTGGFFSEQFNKCYHYFSTKQVYSEAQQVCAGINGRLVTIKNAFEETFIYGSAKQHFASDYWIGLASFDEDGVWIWSDDTHLVYSFWATGYPKADETMRCVAASSENGKWYNYNCDGDAKFFLCEVEMRADVPEQSCPGNGGYDAVENKCFYVFDSLQTYSDALVTCENIGGYLANLYNANKQQVAYEKVEVTHLRDDLWIGLTYAEDYWYEEWFWTWSDYEDFDYSNWESDFPLDDSGMYCGAMLAANGKWYNAMCTDTRTFICETKSGTPAPTGAVTVTPEPWSYYPPTGSSYKVLSLTPKSFDDYISSCAALGAQLVSIHSVGENQFVRALADAHDVENVWIGLRDNLQNNNFTWVDRTDMDYINWQTGYPKLGYYCAAMKIDGTWTNLNCQYQFYVAVCKK